MKRHNNTSFIYAIFGNVILLAISAPNPNLFRLPPISHGFQGYLPPPDRFMKSGANTFNTFSNTLPGPDSLQTGIKKFGQLANPSNIVSVPESPVNDLYDAVQPVDTLCKHGAVPVQTVYGTMEQIPVDNIYNKATGALPVNSLYEMASSPVSSTYDEVQAPVDSVHKIAVSPVGNAYETASDPISRLHDTLRSPVDSVYNTAESPVVGVVHETASEHLGNVHNTVSAPISTVHETLRNPVGSIYNGDTQQPLDNVYETASSSINNVYNTANAADLPVPVPISPENIIYDAVVPGDKVYTIAEAPLESIVSSVNSEYDSAISVPVNSISEGYASYAPVDAIYDSTSPIENVPVTQNTAEPIYNPAEGLTSTTDDAAAPLNPQVE